MKPNKLIWVLAAMLSMLSGMQQLQAAADESVDAKQALAMVKQGALLLDVREPDEYEAIHVPTAKLIPVGQLNSRLKEIEDYKDKPVVVMCRSGRRSANGVALLQKAGFTRVSNMSGGILEWEKEGLEVIRKS